VLQHPTTVLQAALTAIGREDRVVRTNVATLVILLMGLALVATAPNLASFALTRSVAELVRVILLWRGLRMEP
jgi:hypothetical protein